MKPIIVALSGPVCAGKSALAKKLEELPDVLHVKTKDLIHVCRPQVKNTRAAMQKAGDALDRETHGAWVANGVIARLAEIERASPRYVVVNAVRIYDQIERLRSAFGVNLVHLHLTAEVDELARRYSTRIKEPGELADYRLVRANRTERMIDRLGDHADAVIQTDRCTPEDVYVRLVARLGLRISIAPPLVDVLLVILDDQYVSHETRSLHSSRG